MLMEKGRKDKTQSAHPNLHLSGHESIHKRDTRPLMSQPENRSGADRFPYSKPEIDLDRDEYQRLMQAMHIFTKEVRQFETALYEVVRFASHEFQANCQIRLFNEQEKALTLAAIHDQNSHIFQQMHVSLEDFSISIPKGDRETTWLEKNIPFHIQDKTQKKANREVLQILWPFEDHVPLSDLLVVPLTFEETLIGILILTRYASGSDSFSKKDMNYANNFASVAADAIKLALDYDQLQHQVSDQQDQSSVLRNSAQLFRQVFESSSEAIFICDKDGIITYVNDAALQKYGYHREELLDQEISIISLDDLSMNFITEESDLSEHGGAFECLTRQKDGTSIYTEVIIQPFLQEGKKLIQINTRDISDRVLTQNKLETQINRLHAIRAIDLVMKNSAELQSILEFILNQIKLELEVDAVILLQLNEDGNRLTCISAQGFKDKLENKYAPDMENSYAGRIVTNHKIISKNNMDKQEVSNFPDFLTNEQLTSYCGVPLLINEKVKGVIETFSREKFDLNYDWINYLETLAGHAAIAIENYQLFNGLRQSNLDVVKAYDATIAGWSRHWIYVITKPKAIQSA